MGRDGRLGEIAGGYARAEGVGRSVERSGIRANILLAAATARIHATQATGICGTNSTSSITTRKLIRLASPYE